ncbi:MAG: glucan 1,4-alpha-glucosidase [Candidatus Eisenbacteria bacterium]
MDEQTRFAPGWPGGRPRWTSSAKSGVGTSLGPASRVWFTISHGIFNEIYHPDLDRACIRDLGLIVTDGRQFLSEEKRHTHSEVTQPVDGVPAYHLVNRCASGRYRVEKDIIADPWLDVVLQRTRFVPTEGVVADYHVYALLAPHLANHGAGNTAWVGEDQAMPMLFAQRGAFVLALASSAPWLKRSAGFVGVSDGWRDLTRHREMTWDYTRAENGNVALCGEVDLEACGSEFVLALAFGRSPAEAAGRASESLQRGFDSSWDRYVSEWADWQESLVPVAEPATARRGLYRVSAAVLRTHESKQFPGGMIASLSIPWGFSKGDDDLGGYHLVWPRDLVESAGGFLAAGAAEDARRVLRYLEATQEADGHWPQNMWLSGAPYWQGIQMDETAFPILLVDLARREGALDEEGAREFWPMVRRSAGYVARNGPVTQQDRWEEDPGYSPFTLAVEVAALLAGADLAELNGEAAIASYLRETADAWNACIERWTYVSGTDLSGEVGVRGYYVRIAPTDEATAASPAEGFVPIKNRPPGDSSMPASQLVSPDALALVRFGLRAADDPRITDTVKVIDSLLKVETPEGPLWHRYNGDGYGEHEDGSPFDGTGRGRGWPLLVGERAHFELAAGRRDDAERLLKAMGGFANAGGLIPEQVWDVADIAGKELYCGQPSGSAMPLVWAHAEYIKLLRSLDDGRIFDMPPQTKQRYQVERVGSPHGIWRFNHKARVLEVGKLLRLELLMPTRVHWSDDGWQRVRDSESIDTGIGVHLVDLPTRDLPVDAMVRFTFFWPGAERWEGTDFEVRVVAATGSGPIPGGAASGVSASK